MVSFDKISHPVVFSMYKYGLMHFDPHVTLVTWAVRAIKQNNSNVDTPINYTATFASPARIKIFGLKHRLLVLLRTALALLSPNLIV